jgi:RNA polymerase sigma-70 factor, ECF subfamily
VARFRNPDQELRRVYRDHLDAVFAFFAYSLGRQSAEDLTATTFERVVRYDAGLASERTWILAIARNTLIDHYRRQSHRQTTSLDEHPVLLDTIAEQDDPLGRLLSDGAFAGWLEDLRPREREILAMRYGADLSGAEIAALTELSEANVHQIISRTLRKLRAQAEAREAAEAEADRQGTPPPPVEES